MFKGLQSNILLSATLVITISGLAFIGAMAMLCFTKAFGVVFLGSPRTDYKDTFFDVGLTIRTPMIIQCLIIAGIGLFPVQVFSVIVSITSQFVEIKCYSIEPTLIILGNLSKGFFIFLIIAASLWLLRSFMLNKRSVYRYKTWDCGYQAGNVRMQYTASSYAAPFIGIIKPVLDYKEYIEHPARYSALSYTSGSKEPPSDYRQILKKSVADVFPISGSFESHTEDRIETKIIAPVISLISRFLNLFSWIQSGNIQQYILYGLVFLVAITLWIMGS